eukprot:2388833-Rhodomonas_salina.1
MSECAGTVYATHLGVLRLQAWSARRLTCPSRDGSRACHVHTMPWRSRDTGSRDQSQQPRERGITCLSRDLQIDHVSFRTRRS